ncbi:MAG: 3-oxoacyl-[acyl-carrier-protein] synthase [Solirubrobacterales bacterium]|nr:3-oxoacyl-[acyl-carrier-protein] synthase [Solirubrobacterales bacterium]
MPESGTAIPAPAPEVAAPRTALGAEIAGLGAALPETVVTNESIAARFGVDEKWIVQRTGIHSRHYAAEGDLLFELAAAAGQRALADAGVAATELDLIVVATTSNDELMPATASRVGAALGAGTAGAFDLNAACTGFVAGIDVATGLIESGRADHVLLIGADFMSRLTNPEDRATVTVFADGAGAVVLRGTSGAGRIGPVVLGSDGDNADLILIKRDKGQIEMMGHETFRHAVDRLCSATGEALAAAGVAQGEIDLFVYHQANARILRAVGERIELPLERVVDCIAELGNTSAATVPLALEYARREGRLQPGAKVLLGAFGAGLNWGATVIEWGTD